MTQCDWDTLTKAISSDELTQVVESVFVTMLGFDAGKCATPWFPAGGRITAAVHLAGDWNGAVMLECDTVQACRLAGDFLCMEPPAEVDDLVRDVLGELANMIGGNLKSLLTRKIKLSSPTVVDGSSYSLRFCSESARRQTSFQCELGVFWITVVTTLPEGRDLEF